MRSMWKVASMFTMLVPPSLKYQPICELCMGAWHIPSSLVVSTCDKSTTWCGFPKALNISSEDVVVETISVDALWRKLKALHPAQFPNQLAVLGSPLKPAQFFSLTASPCSERSRNWSICRFSCGGGESSAFCVLLLTKFDIWSSVSPHLHLNCTCQQ